MKKILLEDALILSTVKATRFVVTRLPLGLVSAIGKLVGSLIYLFSKRRAIAYANLRAAFAGEKSRAEMKRIARESAANIALTMVEFFRVPEMDQAYVDAHIDFAGSEKLQDAVRDKKGVIFMAAHFGNWEILSALGPMKGYPIVALVRTQKHPRSDEYLNRLRASKGTQIIRKGIPTREIMKELKNGKFVGILSDQDGGKNGIFVRFFNRLSSTPAGAAAFAIRTGATIMPIFAFRGNAGHHRIEVEGPLTIPGSEVPPEEAERLILQQFASILEEKIRRAPELWLWAHRRWKSTPDRFVIILNDGKTGHLNQSLAVLEAYRKERIEKGIPAECLHSKVIDVRYKNNFWRRLLAILSFISSGNLPFKAFWMKAALEAKSYEEIISNYADTVISCGSSLLPVNLMVKSENIAKSIVVMKPFFSARRFDAVIVPRHDKIKKAENIFITDRTPSLMTETYLKEESEKLSIELGISNGRKRVGILIGGDTQEMKFSPKYLESAFSGIRQFCGEAGAAVLATSSRRTPEWADHALKHFFGDPAICPLLVIANEANRAGVVGGILGLSEWVVVSGESMSMVSEAVSSGKPVVIFMPGDKSALKPKYREFLNRMQSDGSIVIADPESVSEALKALAESKLSRSFLNGDSEIIRQAVKRVA